jgi:hypothetical protein
VYVVADARVGADVGVGAVTVGRRLGGDMQCSNSNATDLIEVVIDLVPYKLQEILYEGSVHYHAEIERTFIDHGGEGLFSH